MSEYEVIVKVGNEVIYNESFPGTSLAVGGALDEISIDNPTEYTKNRIREGNFSIFIKYKFKDSKVSTLSAQIDASRIVNQFLSEAQQSTVSQKSSGWSFLGFGSRRKSIKSSFDQQVSEQFSDQKLANTTIEMNDADDQMIKLFEDAFFPTLSQQKAIENHIASAEKARLEGNTELQKLHLDYVKSLQENNPNLEANIGEAVAALSRNDYVGFIANGVRWGDYRAEGNTTFRRVINSNEIAVMQSEWNHTKKVTAHHAVTQKVTISKETALGASLGLIDGIPYQSNMLISNGFSNQWKNIKGIVLGPIIAGGSLHLSNIPPGSLLTKIGSNNVFDGQSLNNVLRHYNPGDEVTLTLIEQIGLNIFQEKLVTVMLGAYPRRS